MGRNTSNKISQKDFKVWIDIHKEQDTYNKEIPLGDVPGFHARMNKSSVSLRLRYKDEYNNKRVTTIGKYPHTPLPRAYTLARAFYGKVINGLIEQDSSKAFQAKKVTLKQYIDDEYNNYLQKLKSGRSIYLTVHKHFEELLHLPIISIKRQHIVKWQAKMEAKQYSAQTIKSTYKSLRAVINHAVKNEFIDVNQINFVKLERIENNTESTQINRRSLSQQELNAFFTGIKKYGEQRIEQRNSSIKHGKKHLRDISKDHYADHYMPIFYTLYYTGMRPGDVLSLEWAHINFDNSEISKVLNKTSHHDQNATKIPICNELKEILKKWHLQNGEPTQGLCYKNILTNKPLSKWAVYKPWDHIKRLAGLDAGLVIYSLRHNFISQLLMENESIFTICKIVGHKNPEMIMKHYGHLSASVAQNAVSKLPKPNFE
jgi:integrase